jgi:hypothetical protein
LSKHRQAFCVGDSARIGSISQCVVRTVEILTPSMLRRGRVQVAHASVRQPSIQMHDYPRQPEPHRDNCRSEVSLFRIRAGLRR